MKFYAVATLVIRLCGMVLCVVVLPFLPGSLFRGYALFEEWFSGGQWWWRYKVDDIAMLLLPVSVFALGLYLLFGGRLVLRAVTRGLVGVCPACGYSLRDLTLSKCPECGQSVRE